jgi:hypothetical protein
MDFDAFTNLPGTEQLRTLGQRGVFLLERYTSEGRYLCYRVRNFYVELIFPKDADHVQVITFTESHPRFLRMLCLMPGASLRSIAEKTAGNPFSFIWN